MTPDGGTLPAMSQERLRHEREPSIEVRRSTRRRRTVSAYREGDRTIVLLPARMSKAEEKRWVEEMVARLDAQERRRAGRAARNDSELAARAGELSRRYLGGVPQPSSVRWVGNQVSRWGSCTPADKTIRLSDRLRSMPSWVVDYVLVHELAHLIELGHGPRFQALVDRYPKAERARGYLLGVSASAGESPAAPDDAADEPDVDPDVDSAVDSAVAPAVLDTGDEIIGAIEDDEPTGADLGDADGDLAGHGPRRPPYPEVGRDRVVAAPRPGPSGAGRYAARKNRQAGRGAGKAGSDRSAPGLW